MNSPNEKTDSAKSSTLLDEELMHRVACKDRQAFEILYRRYYHRVLNFALRIVREQELAEEIVDDTMFAVWRSAAAFEGRSKVTTWLLGIAYRRAMKALSRIQKHQVVDTDTDTLTQQPDTHPGANPETVATADKLQKTLHKAIKNLSDDHRVALEMTAMGYNYHEIADIVNCPHNTVKTRVFHARRQLRGFLAKIEDASLALKRTTLS